MKASLVPTGVAEAIRALETKGQCTADDSMVISYLRKKLDGDMSIGYSSLGCGVVRFYKLTNLVGVDHDNL